MDGRIEKIVRRLMAPAVDKGRNLRRDRNRESGYAMVGLIGVVMFAMILTTAAAPSIKFENQREREEEMLWRGQQIATALFRYATIKGQYPTDLNQLVEGVSVGTKEVRLLRPSALCDPMMPCDGKSSNWRPVHPGDPLVKELLDAYIETQQKGKIMMAQPPAALVQLSQAAGTTLPGQTSSTQPGANAGLATSREDDETGSDGLKKAPIIGVVSRKNDRMFRSYYGIEYYDHSLFFPGVAVAAGGFINPIMIGETTASAAAPKCENGGVLINGKCWGNLTDGVCPPPKRVNPQTGNCE